MLLSLLTAVWMPGPYFLPGCGLGVGMRQWRTGYEEWSVAPSPPPAPDWVISTSPPPLLRLSRAHTLVHCWSHPFHSINLICSLVLSVTRSGSDVISASLLPPVPTPYFLPAARPSPVQCPAQVIQYPCSGLRDYHQCLHICPPLSRSTGDTHVV